MIFSFIIFHNYSVQLGHVLRTEFQCSKSALHTRLGQVLMVVIHLWIKGV